jgi:hypothetical protein
MLHLEQVAIWKCFMNTNIQDSDYHFDKIKSKWNETVQNILDTASFVLTAREQLSDYHFMELWNRDDAPFSLKTAEKLELIAKSKIIQSIKDILPPYWTTIYYISSLNDDKIKSAVDAQIINSECTQKEIEKFLESASTSHSKSSSSTGRYSFGNLYFPPNFAKADEKKFQQELDKVLKKYKVTFESDTSKNGVSRLRKQRRLDEINDWIQRRLKTHKRLEWDVDQANKWHSAANQLFDTGEILPSTVDGSYHATDIRNPNNDYHGWTKKDFYDFARENMIVTTWCKIEEIDKELYIQQLLAKYIDPDSSASDRSDAKKKLKVRASKVGNVQSRASALAALDEIASDES